MTHDAQTLVIERACSQIVADALKAVRRGDEATARRLLTNLTPAAQDWMRADIESGVLFAEQPKWKRTAYVTLQRIFREEYE